MRLLLAESNGTIHVVSEEPEAYFEDEWSDAGVPELSADCLLHDVRATIAQAEPGTYRLGSSRRPGQIMQLFLRKHR